MIAKLNNNLLIIEGPDGAGKSKLSFHLIEKYRFNYLHHGVVPDIKKYHSHSLDIVRDHQTEYQSNWLLDRLHISEYVYGTLFREKPTYDCKDLDKNIHTNIEENGGKYLLIICLPPKENCLAKHAERLANGDEMYNTIEKVYDMYKEFVDQNKDQMKIYIYDYTSDPNYEKIDSFLELGEF